MNYDPFISVVIPTFNRARQTQAALESVLAQIYPKIEAIVVDDGSTDETGEVIQRFVGQQSGSGKQTRYFYQPNQGSSVARNKGIELAAGDWIAFLDSDDVWLPEKLELQVRAIQQFKDECGVCVTDARMVNDLGMDSSSFRFFGRHYDQTVGIASDALVANAKGFSGFWLSTLLVRADLVHKLDGFDVEIQGPEDRDFCFRLALATPFAFIDKPLVRTDRSASPPGSNCRPWDKWNIRLRGHQVMYEKWLRLGPALSPDVRKIVQRELRRAHSHWTNWYLANEQYNEARQAVSKAMHYGFTPNLAVKWMMTRFAPAFARKVTFRKGTDNAVHNR